MFAYCLNNPINYIDSYGESPYSLVLDISDYYVIHKRVQSECRDQKGWLTEVYVVNYDVDRPRKVKRGFLDLYDVDANTFYELKSRHAYELGMAEEQIERYSNSAIKSRKVELKPDDSPKPGTEWVSGGFTYGLWDVSYRYVESGVIMYASFLGTEKYYLLLKLSCPLAFFKVTSRFLKTGKFE